MRTAMITYDGLINIERKHIKSKSHQLEILDDVFEEGMNVVLRELSTKIFNSKVDHFRLSAELEEQQGKVFKLFKDISDSVSTKQDVYDDLETEVNALIGLHERELFIKGFIEGYRFLKELHPEDSDLE